MAQQVEPMSIADLKPDPRNARRHSPRNIGMIEKALGEVGAARSIVIDEDGMVLAGNGVLEAATNAGIERVQVVDADGETIIAVRRRGLTPEQKTKLALYDNRTAELAGWEPVVLGDIGKDIDLGDLFTPVELGDLFGKDEALPTALPEIDIEGWGQEAKRVIILFENADQEAEFWQFLHATEKQGKVVYHWAELRDGILS